MLLPEVPFGNCTCRDDLPRHGCGRVAACVHRRPGDRLPEGRLVYWASAYAATCLIGGAVVAGATAVVRRLWRG